MSSLVLAQVTTSMFAPSIYGTIANGASIASSGALWSAAQGIAGAIGAIAGSVLDRMMFTQSQHYQGPRLSDLSVQTSTEGASLPIVFGTMRLAGNVIWSTGLTEIATTEDQGGGSGGGGSSYTTYSYTTDCAVAICEGTITGIRRIWADTKLMYDVSETATVGTLVASSSYAAGIRIYDGSETQLADPLIEAVEGSAPAYRGTAYIVFEDLRLGDFGNRLPNFTFEVVKVGSVSAFSYINKCEDIGLNDGHRVVCTYADTNGLWVWRIDPSWLISTTPSVYLYNIPYGNTVSILVKTIQTSLPSVAPGSPNSTTYLVPGHADRPVIGVPFVADGKEGLVLVFEDGSQYTVEVTNLVGKGAYSFCVIGDYCFFTQGYNANFKLWKCNYVTQTYNQVIMPWVIFNVVYHLSADYSRLVLIANKASPSENRWLQFNTETLALEKDVTLASTGLLYVSAFTLNNGYIDCLNAIGNGYWYKIKELDSSPVYHGTIPSGIGTWVAQSSQYHWNLFDTGRVQSIWYSYYGTQAKAGFFTRNLLQKTTQNLQTICEQIVAESLLEASQYDFSALSDIEVRGYTITKQSRIRDAIEPLMSAYMFDLIEEDNKIVAKKASATLSKTLSQNELGTYQI